MEDNRNIMTKKFEETATTVNEMETSTEMISEIIPDESERYILIPLIVLFGILVLSALVYLMARNRKFPKYCKRKHKYEERSDDSDTALLRNDEADDPTECLLNGKLQINSRYETYQTTPSKDAAIGEIYS